MLTEQRYEMILNLLEENKSVTVTQIKELLHISESTARRDITALHQAGKLIKVFGTVQGIALLGDGEGDHLQAGIGEDLLEACHHGSVRRISARLF